MKDIKDSLADFDRAYSAVYERNAQCLEDIRFAFQPGAQWAGSDRDQFKNKPKPEANKLFKNINSIIGRFQEAEFGAKISAKSDDADDEDADLLQARWRNDFNNTDGNKAANNAAKEAFFGGFGAFKLVSKYEDEEDPDPDKQYLCVEPIYSAPSSVYFNPGAIREDKRDAKQAWHVQRVNRREIEQEFDTKIATFQSTDNSYFFDWCVDNDNGKDVYIAHYYEVVEKSITEYRFMDGYTITRNGRKLTDSEGEKVEREDLDALLELQPYDEVRRKIKVVEYALMSGDQYLIKPQMTPFKSVPIVPMYGYHMVINGIEQYCGEVCRQRDMQRFLNMGFGALMEIVSQPQTTRPEYTPEQIQKHAQARARSTIDNRPFEMADPIKDKDGNPVHFGPTALHQPPQVGTGLASAIQFLNQNIEEQSSVGQSTLPANTSATAIQQINERTDDSVLPLMTSAVQAIETLCRTWIPAAQKIYFTNPRNIRVMSDSGQYRRVRTLEYTNGKDGTYGPYRHTAKGKYDVSVKRGESYKTRKEAERQSAMELLQYTTTDSPMGQLALATAIQSTTGDVSEPMRVMAKMQSMQILISQMLPMLMQGSITLREIGYTTPEDQQLASSIAQRLIQAQQNQQNPQAQLAAAEAQARMMEGQAALQNEQNDAVKNQIAYEKMLNDRAKVQIDAQKAGVAIDKDLAQIEGTQLDNMQKAANLVGGIFQ